MPENSSSPNRISFTQRGIERLSAPASGNKVYWDANLPSFGLRISSTGRKSWICMYRVTGKSIMETLGTQAVIPSLADARERARKSMDMARSGINPMAARKQAAEAAQAEEADTLDRLLERFIRQHHRHSRPSSIKEVRRLGNRAIKLLGNRPIKSVRKRDILAMMDALESSRLIKWRGEAKAPSLGEARNILITIKAIFKWALRRELIESNPADGIDDPNAGKAQRDRVLSDIEIAALWRIADEIGYPYGRVIQLLLLTGQRLKEVGDLSWSELDLDQRIWLLPAIRAKNGKAHIIHLSDLAMEILDGLPRFVDEDFLFANPNTGKPINSFQRIKLGIDQRLKEVLPNMQPWVLHDLRRSAATRMNDLGIAAPHVIDRILNHVSQGVAAIYNRSEYSREREAALQAWGRHLEMLCYPDRVQSNVLALAGGR